MHEMQQTRSKPEQPAQTHADALRLAALLVPARLLRRPDDPVQQHNSPCENGPPREPI